MRKSFGRAQTGHRLFNVYTATRNFDILLQNMKRGKVQRYFKRLGAKELVADHHYLTWTLQVAGD
jgi:hypothetical protein